VSGNCCSGACVYFEICVQLFGQGFRQDSENLVVSPGNCVSGAFRFDPSRYSAVSKSLRNRHSSDLAERTLLEPD
jgi:hypothetical protein